MKCCGVLTFNIACFFFPSICELYNIFYYDDNINDCDDDINDNDMNDCDVSTSLPLVTLKS